VGRILKFTFLITLWVSVSVTQAAKNTGPRIYSNVDEYNDVHINQALKFWINDAPQFGGTCVCQTMLTMHAALTGKRNFISPEKMKSYECDEINFVYHYRDFQRLHPGYLFGSTAWFYGSSLVSTEEAIKNITESLDRGKVAVVALNARPIYDYYTAKTGRTISSEGIIKRTTSWPIRHAIILIGQQRDKAGKVVTFYVADSSGPERKYSISLDAFRESYSSLHTIHTRAVYIPDKAINPAIRYLSR
jgi:hypothetical protein